MFLQKFFKKDIILFAVVFILVGIGFYFWTDLDKKTPDFNDFQAQPVFSKRTIIATDPIIFYIAKSLSLNINNLDILLIYYDELGVDSFWKKIKEEKNISKNPTFIFFNTPYDNWVKEVYKKEEGVILVNFEDSIKEDPLFLGEQQEDLNLGEYFFMSLRGGMVVIQTIAHALGGADPVNKEFYINNAYDQIVKLQDVYKQSRDQIAKSSESKILYEKKWKRFFSDLGDNFTNNFDISDSKYSFVYLKNIITTKKIKAIAVDQDFPVDDFKKFLEENFLKVKVVVLKNSLSLGDDYLQINIDNLSSVIGALLN
ncbi:MAG: zinc ABC transporter substrate-binding protein [Candidatus Paceibacterota bacterium]|jgi:ABC-type Zn uptake system ZnuABC Zn-binding protein ZnuA